MPFRTNNKRSTSEGSQQSTTQAPDRCHVFYDSFAKIKACPWTALQHEATDGQFPTLDTYVSELHTSSLTQLCDWRICSLRLDEQLAEGHLLTSEERPHAAPGCGLRSSCNRKTSRWRPQSGVTHFRETTRWLTCTAIQVQWQTQHKREVATNRTCTNPGRQIAWPTAFGTAVPDICGAPPVWDWLHITLLVPRILKWLLHLWIICALLPQIILKSFMTSRLHNLMDRFIYNILRPLILDTITA